MMFKFKHFALLTAIVLGVMLLGSVALAQGPVDGGQNWVDADGDGVCDNFVDENGDGVCDHCTGANGGGGGYGRGGRRGGGFVDADGDGVCDNFVDENGDGVCDNCPDADGDGVCDGCLDQDGDGVCGRPGANGQPGRGTRGAGRMGRSRGG